MIKKGRKGDAKGTAHGMAILTDDQVIEIREIYAKGNVTHEELGQRFGVAGGTIANIAAGNKWKHVGGPITRSKIGNVVLRGHKLTMEDAREIRRLYATGKMLQREIGDMFGVSQSSVGMIVRGVIWKDG